ncbi:restriction endonuclease [Mangrovimonas sp. ST2L15]|uniref:restriction endonuclease n=1 Tax=Mangrovimonas sp. ST2L15 TaxID=1645916 RepID=UPI0006B43B47|nr:restriction endonuclease [Mangrovimonas sp. ST2L15]
MSRSKDTGIVLLVAIGLLLFILKTIFDFVSEYYILIGSILLLTLSVYILIRYLKRKKINEKENEIALESLEQKLKEYAEQQTALLEKEFTFLTNNYKEILEKISKEVNKDMEDLNFQNPNFIDIKHILENVNSNKAIDWDSLFYLDKFELPNPKVLLKDFKERIHPLNPPRPIDLNNLAPLSFNKTKLNILNGRLQEIATNKIKEENTVLNLRYSEFKEQRNKEYKRLHFEIDKLKEIWDIKHQYFLQQKNNHNNIIETIKKSITEGNNESFSLFIKILLESKNYNIEFTPKVRCKYSEKENYILVDYLLPELENFPTVKEHRFIKTRNELKPILYTEKELSKIFNETIYKIVLDSINEVYINDIHSWIDSIVLNGWSNAINPSTGNRNTICILSVQTTIDEFSKINLSLVNPKSCFKNLKGISAQNLKDLAPIRPIMINNETDSRFVDPENIPIESFQNLASMHWKDFEHLIREVFEKEFSPAGGSVKVTQASRDGGVDAIAFDPDPIRGGKIVIQAKRYTNTVGVSAVRDLYGTVLNEGASKGILVTTTDYGSDSYNFIKDKPLTLLNGSNLLFLMEKHGYKASIDIEKARKEMGND